MAKIQDKLYNRIIEGELLELSDAEIQSLGLAKASEVGSKLYKHTVMFIVDGEDITFIDNNSSPITLEKLQERADESLILIYSVSQNKPIVLEHLVRNDNFYITYSQLDVSQEKSELVFYTLDLSSNIEDTVTPL